MGIPNFILSELNWKREATPDFLSTGLSTVDSVIEGCPRGRITEVTGPSSSGRTSFLYSVLAEASRLGEYMALVDGSNSFDPASAAQARIHLDRLVWVRCAGNAEHAMRAADLLIHAGGFGVIALDLCDVPAHMLNRIPVSSWYRFRRAVENTPCAFVLLTREPQARATASLLIEMKRRRASFNGSTPVLDHAEFEVASRKPLRARTATFTAQAVE
jgi:hypothetical protein